MSLNCIASLDVMVGMYLDRGFQLEQYRLGDEDFACFCAQVTNLSFKQLNLLSWPASSDFQQAIDYRIKIHLILIGHGVFAAIAGGARMVGGRTGSDDQRSAGRVPRTSCIVSAVKEIW